STICLNKFPEHCKDKLPLLSIKMHINRINEFANFVGIFSKNLCNLHKFSNIMIRKSKSAVHRANECRYLIRGEGRILKSGLDQDSYDSNLKLSWSRGTVYFNLETCFSAKEIIDVMKH